MNAPSPRISASNDRHPPWANAILTGLLLVACTGGGDSRPDPADAPPSPPPAALLDDARRMELAGQHDEAIRLLEAHLDSEPRTRGVHHALAGIHERHGDVEAALRHAEQELALDSQNADAHGRHGRLLEDRGEIEPALTAFRAQARTAPRDWRAQFDVGRLLHRLGDLAMAEAALEQAVALDRTQADPLAELAAVQRENGQLEAALDTYWQALARDPLHVAATYGLGLTLNDLDRSEEGERALARFRELARRADEVDFHSRSPQFALGEELLRAERLGEALAAFRAAAEMDPDSWLAHQRAGIVWARMKNLGQAKTALEASNRLRPGEYATHYWLAETYARMGRGQEALAQVDAAGRVRALGQGETLAVATALLEGNGWPWSRSLLEDYLERQPGDAQVWLFLALHSHRQRDLRRAVDAYRRASAIDAKDPVAQVGLAMAELARGNDGPAREVVARFAKPQLEQSHRNLSALPGAEEFRRMIL